MDHNDTELIIVDGTAGWLWNYRTSTWSQITDTDFPAQAQHVTYLDGFFLVNLANSGAFYKSGSGKGATCVTAWLPSWA